MRPAGAVTYLQHSKQFDQPPLICPCVHTIGFKDLTVPPSGGVKGRDVVEHPKRPSRRLRRPLSIGLSGRTVSFDWQQFFETQIEECRALERQAANGEDRAFWRQAVTRWEEQLSQALRQDKQAHARKTIQKDVPW